MSHDLSTPGERDARLQTETLGSEVVVLDERTGKAYLFRADAAQTWQEADTDLDRRRLLQRAGTLVAASSMISVVLPMASAAASPLPGPLGTPVVNLTPPSNPAPGPNTLDVDVIGAPRVPTGKVSLFTRSGSVDTPVAGQQGKDLDEVGRQAFTVTGGAPGSPAVTYVAKYSGDANYTPAEDDATLTIPKATPTIEITDENNHTTGEYNKVTVTVKGDYGTPTGTLNFSNQGAQPYTITGEALANGTFSYDFKNAPGVYTSASPTTRVELPAGEVTYTVHYSGDGTYAAADSAPYSYEATPPSPAKR